jgi:hypothetical protein
MRLRRVYALASLLLLLPILVAAEPLPNPYRLPSVTVNGKAYYRSFRVTSQDGLKRIANPQNIFRFFQGSGQYGDAFYLFRSLRDAKRFASCEQARGAGHRAVIAEVLLPKEKLDAVAKREVPAALDWGTLFSSGNPKADGLRGLRNESHLLFGRWAPSPGIDEPFYTPMNGAKQFAVVQRGLPSVLTEALIRELPARRPRN